MTVEGLDKLRARFRALPKALQESARKTLEENAEEIVGMMRRLAPVESGALRNSINWTWGAAPAGSMTVGKVAESEDSEISITIYAGTRDKSLGESDAYYARFQEFGTRKMAANPFFFPSVRAHKARGRARLIRNAKKAAKDIFGG